MFFPKLKLLPILPENRKTDPFQFPVIPLQRCCCHLLFTFSSVRRMLYLMPDSEIFSQFLGSFPDRETKICGCKIDHIPVRLATKTMKSLVQFHTGMSVPVERTAYHSIFRHLDSVIFSCLPCSYSVFDCFKYVHSISLPFIYRQSLKGKNIFPFT